MRTDPSIRHQKETEEEKEAKYISIMAYVYRHIRLDKNQPFYIGIGSDDDFRRASATQGRNKFWKAISTKTGYEVEIMMDGLT
uniref:hypothetical protein n=1 Tax=Escherichia coli TaxID=562 RepID=UPI00200EEA5B